MSNFELERRVVLLTGATGHLGAPVSAAILEAGATLVASGRDPARLSGLRQRLAGPLRDRCHIAEGDISNPEGVRALCATLKARFGSLHGIVNNAYGGRVGALDSIEPADFQLACQLNMAAPFMLTRELLSMLERGAQEVPGGASVVNIASMYGSVSPDPAVYGDAGTNNPVHYGATKAGMLQLTRYLACHLGEKGIRVNSVSPGPFPRITAEPDSAAFAGRLAAKVPMGRVGRPEELAGPVVFLLSSAASYINGIDLRVDGGWTAW